MNSFFFNKLMLSKKSKLKFEINNENFNHQRNATECKEKKKETIIRDNPESCGNFYKLYYDRRVRKPDETYKEYNCEYFETGEIDKAPGLAGIFESQLNDGFEQQMTNSD